MVHNTLVSWKRTLLSLVSYTGRGAKMSKQEDSEYSSLQTVMILVFSICNLKLIIMHMGMFI